MSFRPSRRIALLALPALLLLAVGAFALVRSHRDEAVAQACPPGFASPAERQLELSREHASEGDGPDAEAAAEKSSGAGCTPRKHPESKGDLLKMQGNSGRSARGGAPGVRSGAYAHAVRQRARLAANAGTLPGSGGAWTPAGHGPLIGDDANYDEVNGQGLADQNGRPSDFAFDPAGRRLFAAIGEGGVWTATEGGGYNDWKSIGDPLPTQAIGGIGYSSANGGTIIVSTGDNVFGGGGTFSGLGVYRTTDDGKTWQHATGVPGGIITFKIKVDPSNPQVVYAATGAGLYRSTDAGATFANVDLPTGQGVASGQPDCTGKGPDVEGCYLANMVTDVVVRAPGGSTNATGGAVTAVVGWRAGDKTSQPSQHYPSGYVESPNNGIYTSDSGAPGSFTKVDTSAVGPSPVAANGFTAQDRIGRIELGEATGPQQDHDYLYAVVEDAQAFNGGAPSIDAPETEQGVPNNTVLDGIYVSSDFGKNWTLMEDAQTLDNDPTTGSGLTGTGCGQLYCPGVQAWYNQQISVDPTRATAQGVPTRMVFGIEEVWQNRLTDQPLDGPTQFKVIGPYFSGTVCVFLNNPTGVCPFTAGDPTAPNTTTHPDQHASIWLPDSQGGGATLVVGNDGGVYAQHVAATGSNAEFSADNWGRGNNQGLYTLLPYDAQVAKDGTVWAGLQDNGEMKIQPDGRQVETYGGDGTFSAVDPDDSNVAYESYTDLQMNKTVDGGKTWTAVPVPSDTYQFVNPFTMDPADANHLITAGNKVSETTDGGDTWTQVFDLGLRDPNAASSSSNPDNAMSAIDTRGTGAAVPSGPHTPDFTFGDGSSTHPDPTGSDLPGSYEDKPFTIGANDGDAKATIKITWGSSTDDWDLVVYKKNGSSLDEVGSSANGGTTEETVVLSKPRAGDYVIRVRNFTASGTYSGTATFAQAAGGDVHADRAASYVAFCGYCDALNTRPFDNGVATNVQPDGSFAAPGSTTGWHRAAAAGLPKRFITSIQIDPSDAKTVYVTLGGYSRRWLQPGVLGENADLGGGNVYKSTDAGASFHDISGDLPDIPANWTLVHNGQLLVATNMGVFISSDTDGGGYELLGSGLPTAPVFTLELKPKANPAEKDTLIAATQGRGVYKYVFANPVKPNPGTTTGAGSGSGAGGSGAGGAGAPGGGPTACKASRALTSASVTPAGGGLKLRFSRSVKRPVQVDVFQESSGRRVITERLVARFANAKPSFTWNGIANRAGKRVSDGIYMVRFRLRESNGLVDTRRIDRQRAGGAWSSRPAHYGREGCTLLRAYKLERPAFGGTTRKPLGISYRLLETATVTVTVKRGPKVVKRYKAVTASPDTTHRLRFAQTGRPRGDYKVTVTAVKGNRRQARTLTSRKL
jgi:photosystem II stability/assembly factor-like uncharacterized protein